MRGKSMQKMTIRPFLLSAAFVTLAGSHASALTIVPDFSTLGTVYRNASGTLSNTESQGSADVTALFRGIATYVASTLDKAVGVRWTETISFKLTSLTGAVANSGISNVNNDGRPSESRINIDTGTAFFLDPTPADNSEFAITSRSADLGGGSVNVSRIGNAIAGSGAEGLWDLETVLLHEMEHSIAYNAGLDRYKNNVVQDPNNSLIISTGVSGLSKTFEIPLTTGSHIDGQADNGLFNDTVIADPGFFSGQRALLTAAEIYGACQIAGCTGAQANTDPYATVSPVPLPASGVLMLGGIMTMLGLGLARRSMRSPTAAGSGA